MNIQHTILLLGISLLPLSASGSTDSKPYTTVENTELKVSIPYNYRSSIGIKIHGVVKGKPMIGGANFPPRKQAWGSFTFKKISETQLQINRGKGNIDTYTFKAPFRILKAVPKLKYPGNMDVVVGYITVGEEERPIRLALQPDMDSTFRAQK